MSLNRISMHDSCPYNLIKFCEIQKFDEVIVQ